MGNAAALVGGIDPAAGKLPRARHACKRTRFVEPRDGEPCVEVGGERFGDQRIERRVAELTPPGGLGRRAANAHRLRGIGARRLDLRRHIVGANGGTSGKAKKQNGGRKLGDQCHWVSSCGLVSGLERRRASRRKTVLRSEEHTSELQHYCATRLPASS